MSVLLSYFAYYIAEGATNDILCSIGSTLCFAARGINIPFTTI